ncbi:MAG: helix-turn-helix domain-containing protein [Acetobacterium wieringae]|nr:helix-turn-helix domain-containing protein [Acetobacterium wieringae]
MMITNDHLQLLSVAETAELLGLSLNSMYMLLNTDPSFPAIRIGKKWVIQENRIPEWITQQMTKKNVDKN